MQSGLEMFTCSISMFPQKIKHLNYLPALDCKLPSHSTLRSRRGFQHLWLTYQTLPEHLKFFLMICQDSAESLHKLWTIKKKKYIFFFP